MDMPSNEEPEAPKTDLRQQCLDVLKENDRGDHTSPAKFYPHQWLWDSCFVSIGLRHVDPKRAAKELITLTKGQWSNGMIPHMIFDPKHEYYLERDTWRSWLSPFAPDKLSTSGITQPPLLAEAVVKVGQKMNAEDRREFYRQMYEPLLDYHQWLYAERDPHKEGLTLQIHPHEVGMDNTPPWMEQLYEHSRPLWIVVIEKLRLDWLVNLLRRDTRKVSPGERITNLEALLLWDIIRKLRRKHYDIDKIMHRSLFYTEDITFNSIMARSNTQLENIASYLHRTLPAELLENMKNTEKAFTELFDEATGQYYSRDFITHKLIVQPTIGTFMPLYAGCISKDHARRLAELLKSRSFWMTYPVPSVPLSSEYFNDERYWQGPSWVNTNWLIIEGLRRYKYDELADELQEKTLAMVTAAGPYEYFSPIDGRGLGAENFSWTAALAIDLLEK